MEESEVICPFCGENIIVVIDCSVDDQTYIEDCSVCCKPISLRVRCSDNALESIEAGRS